MKANKSVLFSLALLAGTAIGAITNGWLNLGDDVLGVVEDLDQTDTYLFSAIAGTKLTVGARAYGVSKTLNPRVRVTDQSTNTVLVDASNDLLVYIKKLQLPTTGEYMISISGAQDTLGAYKMKTDQKLGFSLLHKKGWATPAGGGGQVNMTFDAAPGWSLEAKVAPKSAHAFMTSATLLSPSGQTLELSDHLLATGPTLKIQDLQLPELGTYQLSALNTALTGLVRWHLTIDPDGD